MKTVQRKSASSPASRSVFDCSCILLVLLAGAALPVSQELLGEDDTGLFAIGVLVMALTAISLRYLRNRNAAPVVQLCPESVRMLDSTLADKGRALLLADHQGSILKVNAAFAKLTGTEPGWLEGRRLESLRPEHSRRRQASAEHHREWGRQLLQDGWSGEIRTRAPQASGVWLSVVVNSSPLPDGGGIFAISATDITEIKSATQHMEKLALYDALTGLANRRLFMNRLHAEMAAQVTDQRPRALFFLDLDRFKQINDTMGHDAGDLLLTIVAQRLRDAAGKDALVARLGGDEFTILLSRYASARDPVRVARRILAALKVPFDLAGHQVTVTTSIGITIAPDDGRSIPRLMKNADLALYCAKAGGKNRYHLFCEDLNRIALQDRLLEQELQHALQFDQFELHYQPRASLQTGRIVAVEALLRWRHPRRGLLAPEAFMAVAERSGLIAPMGRWILNTACKEIHALEEEFGIRINLSVNLAQRQFEQPDLLTQIRDALEAAGLAAHRLELEISEGLFGKDDPAATDRIGALKSLGVRIAIDHYGTGHLSLRQLFALELDVLKIDPHFSQDMLEGGPSSGVVKAIIALGQQRGLIVVAGQVESMGQAQFLRAAGCREAQGYLYSKPLAITALGAWLDSNQKVAAGVSRSAVSALGGANLATLS